MKQTATLFVCTWAISCGSSAIAPGGGGLGDASTAQDTGTSIAGPTGTPQALHDVSVLWPLPTSVNQIDLLLSPTSSGAKGELLPAAIFQKMPQLSPAVYEREKVRVVALRIDPCFRFGTSTECSNQLRLVMQPIDTTQGKVIPQDAAVHAFYSLTREQLKTLAAAIAGHSREPTRALDVHPTLANEGLDGTFATRLRALVGEYAGASNLVRATFMQRTNSRQGTWVFGGFEISGNNTTDITIETMGVKTQEFTTVGFTIQGTATPELKAADNPSLFFNETAVTAAGSDKAQAAYDGVLRVLNPAKHTPETIDCVSCHTATSSKAIGEKLRGFSAANNPNVYKSTFDLAVTTNTSGPDKLRAFGYFDTQPMVSARVANESAAVLNYLQTEVFKP